MAFLAFKHDIDPKDVLIESLGDVSGVKIQVNRVLVAVYERPQKLASGIYRPQDDEDKRRGQVGLLVSVGPQAFVDDAEFKFGSAAPEIGDWVVFPPYSGVLVNVNGVPCRLMKDSAIDAVSPHPDFMA
jgi:co-chaperonin GroES (HSP10)